MRIITKERMLSLVKDGATLVDLRSPIEFRDYKIEGSINLPLRNFASRMMSEKNKNAKYIIFSNSSKDKDIELALRFASEYGISNIFVSEYQRLRDVPKTETKPSNKTKVQNRPKPNRNNVTITVKKTRKGV